ncbi:MAG: hypothetical protein ACLGG0_14115 [Bacteriovoracia bacterium]
MKQKNPLYVVKGQNVEQAKNFFDMLIKKLELEPVINFLQSMITMLMEQVKSYPTFVLVKNMIDQWMAQLMPILQTLSGMLQKA